MQTIECINAPGEGIARSAEDRNVGETLSEKSRDGESSAALLTGAGNLSPVAAKHELLDVIGDRFTEREETCACLALRDADDLGREM